MKIDLRSIEKSIVLNEKCGVWYVKIPCNDAANLLKLARAAKFNADFLEREGIKVFDDLKEALSAFDWSEDE